MHPFETVVGVGVLSIFCNCVGWEQMEEFAQHTYALLSNFFAFPNGVPGHDTFSRVFQKICPEALRQALRRTGEALSVQDTGLTHLAMDGKTLCGSRDDPNNCPALHIVSAWAVSEKQVVDCEGVRGKGHELALLKTLLERLELKDKLISIDAIGCQREICSTITEAKGHYLIGLKGNQSQLFKDVCLAFETPDLFDVKTAYIVDKDHGRLEERTVFVMENVAWLKDRHDWPGLQQIGKIHKRTERKGKITSEERFFICSAALTPEHFQTAVRDHWGIENSQHYVLDDTLREDRLRIRKKGACENIALLQRVKLNLLQQAKKLWNLRSIPKTQRTLSASPEKIIQILHRWQS